MVSNSAEIVDDQYYAIKDNISSEYNVVAFKPKDVPNDPSYGHTIRRGIKTVMDETYYRAEGSGALLHIQSQEGVSDCSHLNQSKPNSVPKAKHNAVVHQFK